MNKAKKLLRRGEFAKALGIPDPTVKYYTRLGLFSVKNKTRFGQFLYDLEPMKQRYARIKELKAKRLTIEEIKDRLKMDVLIED